MYTARPAGRKRGDAERRVQELRGGRVRLVNRGRRRAEGLAGSDAEGHPDDQREEVSGARAGRAESAATIATSTSASTRFKRAPRRRGR